MPPDNNTNNKKLVSLVSKGLFPLSWFAPQKARKTQTSILWMMPHRSERKSAKQEEEEDDEEEEEAAEKDSQETDDCKDVNRACAKSSIDFLLNPAETFHRHDDVDALVQRGEDDDEGPRSRATTMWAPHMSHLQNSADQQQQQQQTIRGPYSTTAMPFRRGPTESDSDASTSSSSSFSCWKTPRTDGVTRTSLRRSPEKRLVPVADTNVASKKRIREAATSTTEAVAAYRKKPPVILVDHRTSHLAAASSSSASSSSFSLPSAVKTITSYEFEADQEGIKCKRTKKAQNEGISFGKETQMPSGNNNNKGEKTVIFHNVSFYDHRSSGT